MENIEPMQATPDQLIESLKLSGASRTINTLNHIHPADAGEESCPTCSASKNAGLVQYVYTIGRIQPRFPNVSIEKEFMQATSRKNTAGLSDNQSMHTILSEPQNRYLARKLCWVLSIQGLETYLLQPMNPADIDMLIDSLRPTPKLTDINVVIGILGPIAPPQYCNGLQIPIVGFDQVYSFDVDSLINAIPKPGKGSAKAFEPVAEELFMKIMQMTDNAGATDDHRVLNYLAVRYHEIYAKAADCYSRNCSLTGVEVLPSALSGTRKIMEVIFTFSNRSTDVTEKHYCRVDVTEEFPFLVTKMQTYIDR
jgi:PatG Domain